MKTINGYQYSKKEFPEYMSRVKINICDKMGVHNNIDIYTTRVYNTQCGECRSRFKSDFLIDIKNGLRLELIEYVEIINVTTKEQDVATTAMLFEMFDFDKFV